MLRGKSCSGGKIGRTKKREADEARLPFPPYLKTLLHSFKTENSGKDDLVHFKEFCM